VPADDLRVLDFGRVAPLRSQTLWHAIAAGVSAGASPTLSFLRPAAPYVCIGFHRRLDEVDLAECRVRDLPVFRRMVGGGPVYLDDGQLFFQITVPASSLPPVRTAALRRLLAPAVAAFRECGIDAELDDAGEIVVGDRKVCGHGAGQLGDAVVVVGNLIERFDHEAAAAVLQAPSAVARAEVLRLMRRYVAPTAVDAGAFRASAVRAYGESLDLPPRTGSLTNVEQERLDELDRRFSDPGWVRGADRPEPRHWQVKIRAGVSVLAVDDGASTIVASMIDGRIDRAVVIDPGLNGAASAVGDALAGRSIDDLGDALAPFGPAGHRMADTLVGAARSLP
jgi:lipoate-protein ligase A